MASMAFGADVKNLIDGILADLGVDWDSLPEQRKIVHLKQANEIFTDIWNDGFREGRAEGRFDSWP